MAKVAPKAIFEHQVKSGEDIEVAINENEEVKKRVDSYLKQFSIVSISDTMKDLSNVGELLKVANAASYGQKQNQSIKTMLNDYQSLIYKSIETTAEYVSTCISCIKYLKMALKIALKMSGEQDVQKCLSMIEKTGKKATSMKEKADELLKLSKDLSEKSMNALVESTDTYVKQVQEMRENDKKKDQLSSDIEGLKVEIEALREQIVELQELEDKAREEALEQARWDGFLSFLRSIVKGIKAAISPIIAIKDSLAVVTTELTDNESKKQDVTSVIINSKKQLTGERKQKKVQLVEKTNRLEILNQKGTNLTDDESKEKEAILAEIPVLEKAISDLKAKIKKVMSDVTSQIKEKTKESDSKEETYKKYKNEYIAIEMKASNDLYNAISQLKSLSDRNEYLEMSCKSLEIVIISMGKIRTSFENCGIFWSQVSTYCKGLSNVSRLLSLSTMVASEDKKIKFVNTIKSSCINWLSMAKVNHDAQTSIEKVRVSFDLVMTNLPGREESPKIVKECIDSIHQNASDEIAKLEDLKKTVVTTSSNPSQ